MCRVDGKLVANPTKQERSISDIDILYVGNKNDAIMIEGKAKQVPESELKECFTLAQAEVKKVIAQQESELLEHFKVEWEDSDDVSECTETVYNRAVEELTRIFSEKGSCQVRFLENTVFSVM